MANFFKMIRIGRNCSTLFENAALRILTTNAVRTIPRTNSDEYRKRRAIKKSLEERSIRASTASLQNTLYLNNPFDQTFPYLLPLLGDTFVTFPALLPTMKSGEVFVWRKLEGDMIVPGEVLAEIHTDEGIKNFEAPVAGYLAKRIIKTGDQDVPVGCLMCIIVENKNDVIFYEKNMINIYGLLSRSSILKFKSNKLRGDKMVAVI